ncbi:MAG: sigma-70 family RNA polymerase sigma factor [Syntrophobacteraceae bacterium]
MKPYTLDKQTIDLELELRDEMASLMLSRQRGAVPSEITSERDTAALYIKQVSLSPRMTMQRELELAKAIGSGWNELTGIVEKNVKRDKIFADLSQKVRELLKLENAFPGVREKTPEIIMRTLERATREQPDNPFFRQSLERAKEIINTIDSARNEMVQGNLRLVLSIAKLYRGRGMTFDDLVQEGNIGLIRAVVRFDHSRGNRFTTYAAWWIRQSIIRSIYDKARLIRLPLRFIELKNCIFKSYYELFKEFGREPTPAETADRAGVPVKEVQRALMLAAQPVSLESCIGGTKVRLEETLEDEDALSPVEEYYSRELVEIMHKLLSTLKPREEKILRMRFGFDGGPVETLEVIGKKLQLSKERIRQIQNEALNKLKNTDDAQPWLRNLI